MTVQPNYPIQIPCSSQRPTLLLEQPVSDLLKLFNHARLPSQFLVRPRLAVEATQHPTNDQRVLGQPPSDIYEDASFTFAHA